MAEVIESDVVKVLNNTLKDENYKPYDIENSSLGSYIKLKKINLTAKPGLESNSYIVLCPFNLNSFIEEIEIYLQGHSEKQVSVSLHVVIKDGEEYVDLLDEKLADVNTGTLVKWYVLLYKTIYKTLAEAIEKKIAAPATTELEKLGAKRIWNLLKTKTKYLALNVKEANVDFANYDSVVVIKYIEESPVISDRPNVIGAPVANEGD